MSNQLGLLLLIVVISGALCTVEDYVIMSQCAHNKAIHLAAEGTVSVTDISQTQNITIVGLPDYVNNDFKIALYAKETQRYLCFNENWKLVGMSELRDTCYFNETIVHGYFVFRSVVDLQRRVGFTHRGKAVGPKKSVNDACYLFTKIQADQFFHQHTDYFAPKSKTTSQTPTSVAAAATSPAATYSSSAPARSAVANRTKSNRTNKNRNNRNNGMRNNSKNNSHNSGSSRSSSNNNNQMQQQQHSHGGHSSNRTNLSSSTKQQLGLRQHNQQQQHQQQQQQHLVRHHHNDPNAIARRQQHEHKQKRRQRNRLRATLASPAATIATKTKKLQATASTRRATATATTAAAATIATPTKSKAIAAATTATTQTAFSISAAEAATITTTTTKHRKKQYEITPTNVVNHQESTATNVAATISTAANKRKGRRRKGERMHKKHSQQQQQQQKLHKQQEQQQQKLPAALSATFDGALRSTSAWDDVASSISSATETDDTGYGDESTTSLEPFSTSAAATTTTAFDDAYSSTANELDFAASTATMSNVDSNDLLATTGQHKNAATLATLDSSMLLATSQTNSITRKQSLYATQSAAEATPAYTLPDTWSPATFYDELETSVDGEPLLAPTPMLFATNVADELPAATWQSHVDLLGSSVADNDNFTTTTSSTESDSNSNFTFEAADSSSEDNDTAFENEFLFDDSENMTISSNFNASIADDMFETAAEMSNASSRTTAYVAPTLATLYNSWRKTQRQHVAGSQQKSATSTVAAPESSNIWQNGMTDYIYSTRSSHTHKHSRHRNVSNNNENVQQLLAGNTSQKNNRHSNKLLNKSIAATAATKSWRKTSASTTPATFSSSSSSSSMKPLRQLFNDNVQQHVANTSNTLLSINKNINNGNTNNTIFEVNMSATKPTATDTVTATAAATATASTATKKSLRQFTQRLLATPFHQLTYVRNNAGDIDIDNMDNISVYPDLLEADVADSVTGESGHSRSNNSRLTIVSGYLPTSATAILPESIRIAKIKINKERKRMLRQRHVAHGGHQA